MIDRKRKIRNGFQGEKLISLPAKSLKNIEFNSIYITHIGYYPKARYHYRRRRTGCEDNILFYCLHGKGYYVLNGVKFELNANQFVIIPSTNDPLSYWADLDDPWTIYWVHFTGKELSFFNQSFRIGIDNSPTDILYNEEGIDIWHKMYDSISQGYSPANLMNANLCLYHFIATFIYARQHNQKEVDSDQDNMIDQTIQYIHQHLGEKISVEEMAQLHNLSESYFSKLFRTATGMPPLEYCIHKKMQEACRLLYTTDCRVNQIAYTLGYDDSYYFSRLFKKYIYMSPENYRKSMKRIDR